MELPNIGAQCSVKECAQLDFLPIECAHCHQTFCSAHCTPPEAHQCTQIPDNVLSDADVENREKCQSYKCSFPSCSTKEVVEMKCIECNQHFCLNHRHENQHDCPSLKKAAEQAEQICKKVDKKQTATQQVQAQVQQQITTKLQEVQQTGDSKNSAMAAKLALMKLKGRAKGDNAIPVGERLFFSIECPNKQQNPKPLDLFLSSRWSMGKIIDVIAREARIKNRNNQIDAPKLHLFNKNDNCLSKPSDKILNDLIESGLIVNGDLIIFKYLEE